MENTEKENQISFILDLKFGELHSISGGGFFKDLGYMVGSFYDIHHYKGGEWNSWG